MYSNLQHKNFPNHNSDKTIHHTKTGNINKKEDTDRYHLKSETSKQLAISHNIYKASKDILYRQVWKTGLLTIEVNYLLSPPHHFEDL